jgi:hypothetical protein
MATIVPGRFSKLKAQMISIATVQTDGNVAWVIGTENAAGKNKAGEPLSFDLFVTNIYKKEDGKVADAAASRPNPTEIGDRGFPLTSMGARERADRGAVMTSFGSYA